MKWGPAAFPVLQCTCTAYRHGTGSRNEWLALSLLFSLQSILFRVGFVNSNSVI